MFRIFDVVCSWLAFSFIAFCCLTWLFRVSVVVNWLWWRHLPNNLITYFFPFFVFLYISFMLACEFILSCVYISLVHLIHVIVYHACYFNWTLIIKFILIVFFQLVYDNELLLHCILMIDVLLNCLIYFLSQCRCKHSAKFSVRNFD